jgi:protein SCO1/2
MSHLDRFLDRPENRASAEGVRLVSISVDPVHDTPPVLARYGASFQASPRWLFLTGGRGEVLRLITQGFKLGVDDSPAPKVKGAEPIIHSTRFVLVDGEGNIRGYYGAFTDGDMDRLREDLLQLAGAG